MVNPAYKTQNHMKSLKLFLLLVFPLFFTSCLEINEEIAINKNGSGSLSMKTDMGKLFEMLEAFMPADELKKSEFATAKDTVILMKDIVDTLQSMTADKKAVLRDGSIHLKMNLAEKQFMVDMNFPFSKMADISKIYANLGDAQSGMGQLLKGASGDTESMNRTCSITALDRLSVPDRCRSSCCGSNSDRVTTSSP